MTQHLAVARTLRSLIAGAGATFADLLVLALLTACGLSARAASLPALLVGGAVNFVGNRSFAFRAKGHLARHALLFVLVEAGTLALNALVFEVALRSLPVAHNHYLITRLLVSNVVFMGFSYPLWTRVFAPKRAPLAKLRP